MNNKGKGKFNSVDWGKIGSIQVESESLSIKC